MGDPPHQTFHLALNPTLSSQARERLVAHLQGLRTSGEVSALDDQESTLHVLAPTTARNSLARLPGVLFVSDADPMDVLGVTADGFITGVVTVDDGATPLAGARIAAYQSQPYIYRSTSADAGGVYSLSVPPGSYEVVFYSPDYHINEYYDDVPFATPDAYTPVIVGDGETVPNINASLAPGVQIRGRVTDEATAGPLWGISVAVGISFV